MVLRHPRTQLLSWSTYAKPFLRETWIAIGGLTLCTATAMQGTVKGNSENIQLVSIHTLYITYLSLYLSVSLTSLPLSSFLFPSHSLLFFPFLSHCGLIRPDASYSGGGKERVDFGLLLAVLLSLDGVVPGSVLWQE